MSELIAKLRHLVSLNDIKNGGPYKGHAAVACMEAMQEAILALEAGPETSARICEARIPLYSNETAVMALKEAASSIRGNEW